MDVGVMKPVESGCELVGGRPMPQDAVFLREAADVDDPLELVCPYCLKEPLAPALAAERSGISVDVEQVRRAFEALAGRHEMMIVEGAGGLLAPLSGAATNRDLARLLGLPMVIVARNVLGAVNHAALTVEAARRGGLEVAGIIVNNVRGSGGLAEETNPASLERWSGAPVLAALSHQKGLSPASLALGFGRKDLERTLLAAGIGPRTPAHGSTR
jgi:dethiobiotin synthetase